MARHERHLLQLADVPGADDDAPRIRDCAQLLDDLRDLVDAAPVRRRPCAPLLAVDRPELAVLVRPLIPDGHAVLAQPGDVGLAAQEPQQLVDHRAHVDLLGGDEREALRRDRSASAGRTATACRCRCGRLCARRCRARGAAVRDTASSLRATRLPDGTRRRTRSRAASTPATIIGSDSSLAHREPAAGEIADVLIRHAHELDREARHAVEQQEQPGRREPRPRLRREPPQHREQHDAFEEGLVELRGVAHLRRPP